MRATCCSPVFPRRPDDQYSYGSGPAVGYQAIDEPVGAQVLREVIGTPGVDDMPAPVLVDIARRQLETELALARHVPLARAAHVASAVLAAALGFEQVPFAELEREEPVLVLLAHFLVEQELAQLDGREAYVLLREHVAQPRPVVDALRA